MLRITPHSPWYQRTLLGTVYLTGAAVLIFEIAAVRVLSPYFGASIYVVSGVLTVILTALSLGYYCGGRLADRHPSARLLYGLIALSGTCLLGLFTLAQLALPIAGLLLPLTVGPLLVALLCFFVPAFLLGIDSPFVIKLLTEGTDEQTTGTIVGTTFFWSTFGSITGSLLAGFVLIPFLGLQLTFILTALILTFGSFVVFQLLAETPATPWVSTNRLVLLVCLTISLSLALLRLEPVTLLPGDRLLYTDGLYSGIEVREIQTPDGAIVRSLHREVNNSSAVYLSTVAPVFPYMQYLTYFEHLRSTTSNILMLGGGAYTGQRQLLAQYPNLTITTVEIEPALLPLAHTYFDLPQNPRHTNITMDGRAYLARSSAQYDVIFMDVYNSGHFIPPHLLTHEFFTTLKRRLAPDGVLIANVIGHVDNPNQNLTGSIIRTALETFPHLSIYSPANDPTLRNLLFFARADNATVQLPNDLELRMVDGSRQSANATRIKLERFHLAEQMILTDDRAPIAQLVARQHIENERRKDAHFEALRD